MSTMSIIHNIFNCFLPIRVPPKCEPTECTDLLMWNDIGNGTVTFYISSKIDPKLKQSDSVWTAMGLSNNTEMVIFVPQNIKNCILYYKKILAKII